MNCNSRRQLGCRGALAAIVVLMTLATQARAVTIDTVGVGNPGNPSDTDHGTGRLRGAVAYDYRIGTYEVTNSQYVEFLNAKAASDPLGLYSEVMASDFRGGITRSGSDGSYTYAVKTDMGNKPVNRVNWYDSMRFANWLQNGQGSGDTETGTYTLLGGTPIPSNGVNIPRNAGAAWVLPTENEWYKAAYYQPAAQGGDADGYWYYPTASNSEPTVASASAIGDISNPGANVANYLRGADWNGQDGNVTTVGSAGPLSTSFYGTFDQAGNVDEWVETVTPGFAFKLGGQWFSGSGIQTPSEPGSDGPSAERDTLGFRVALVPEPSTFLLSSLACSTLCALAWRRARKLTR
jgi:formylglycine-generating enzyme required for sulfatase activity